MLRKDTPITTDDAVPALLTEDKETILQVISDIPKARDPFLLGALELIQRLQNEGKTFSRADECLTGMEPNPQNSRGKKTPGWSLRNAIFDKAGAQFSLAALRRAQRTIKKKFPIHIAILALFLAIPPVWPLYFMFLQCGVCFVAAHYARECHKGKNLKWRSLLCDLSIFTIPFFHFILESSYG